jgi:hypothetical protein
VVTCLRFILKVFDLQVSKRTEVSHFLKTGFVSCSKSEGHERERAVEIREFGFHSALGWSKYCIVGKHQGRDTIVHFHYFISPSVRTLKIIVPVPFRSPETHFPDA